MATEVVVVPCKAGWLVCWVGHVEFYQVEATARQRAYGLALALAA